MKRIIALFLVLVLVLPIGITPALAEDIDMTEEEVAELLFVLALASEMEKEESGNRNNSSSKKNNYNDKRSPTYVTPSKAPVTYVTPYNAYVQTNGGDLNVRAKANKGATILTKLYNGESLVVNGYTGGWYQVTAHGKTGFVPSRYVSAAPEEMNPVSNYAPSTATAPVSSGTGYYAMVNPSNNFVNMRAEPSKNSAVKGVYYYGYELKVLSQTGSWSQVLDEANGTIGYMMTSFLIPTNTYSGAGDQG